MSNVNQENVIFGVNILETLTTGMYSDPKVIYREYIQNSCDAIDEAVESGFFDTICDGKIEIRIKNDSVVIEDNATAIPAMMFRETLYSIGNSKKTAGKSRGFRGIGHWCGFAHCEKLVFISKARGEDVESVMECDAAKMRDMMLQHRLKRAEYSIDDVLSNTTNFSTNLVSSSVGCYFKVKMFGINDSREELCDEQKIREYLSFVVPVAYATAFHFRDTIHKYAANIDQTIHEYDITINGGAVLKKYQTSFSTSKGEDSVMDVKFKQFYDDRGNLIAWMWFGVSSFRAQIVPSSIMRGIRLRSLNIQLGRESTLQRLFNESNGRGLYYYVGEVFSVSNDLLPDSQRNYFEPCSARTQFERVLSDFFNGELRNIYYDGSKVGSALDKIEKAIQIEDEISLAEARGETIPDDMIKMLEDAKDKANVAEKEIENRLRKCEERANESNQTIADSIVKETIKRRRQQLENRQTKIKMPAANKSVNSIPIDTLSSDSRQRQPKTEKLVSLDRIYEIINKAFDPSTAKMLITKINEELL